MFDFSASVQMENVYYALSNKTLLPETGCLKVQYVSLYSFLISCLFSLLVKVL